MPNTTTSPTLQLRTLRALMIYDDLTSAKQAAATLKRAAHQAKIGVGWDLKAWRLDIFKLPLAGDEALLEAADAEMIAFVGPRASSLPSWLKQWLECWANLRQIGNAALIVLGDGDGSLGRAAVQFSRFAKSHGLSLLLENDSTVKDGLRSPAVLLTGSQPHLRQRKEKATATFSPVRGEVNGTAKVYADAH